MEISPRLAEREPDCFRAGCPAVGKRGPAFAICECERVRPGRETFPGTRADHCDKGATVTDCAHGLVRDGTGVLGADAQRSSRHRDKLPRTHYLGAKGRLSQVPRL